MPHYLSISKRFCSSPLVDSCLTLNATWECERTLKRPKVSQKHWLRKYEIYVLSWGIISSVSYILRCSNHKKNNNKSMWKFIIIYTEIIYIINIIIITLRLLEHQAFNRRYDEVKMWRHANWKFIFTEYMLRKNILVFS